MNNKATEKTVWPFPVKVGVDKPYLVNAIVIKELSDESKVELWEYLRIEDPFFSGFLKQLRNCEVKQEKEGIPENKILRFDVRLSLSGKGSSLQKKIVEREKTIHNKK